MKHHTPAQKLLVLVALIALSLAGAGARTLRSAPEQQRSDTDSSAGRVGETITYSTSPQRAPAAAGAQDILLIQTNDPWERSSNYIGANWYDGVTADTKVLDSLGYSYRIATWNDISAGNVNIFSYPVILIVNDQVQAFYDD